MNKPSRRQIAEAAVRLMQKGVSASTLSMQLAAYLLSQRRTSELGPLMRDINDIRSQDGLVEVTAISARTLDSSVKAQIKDLSSKSYPNLKHVLINEEINQELVGGMILKAGDLELDLSVNGRLKNLKAAKG